VGQANPARFWDKAGNERLLFLVDAWLVALPGSILRLAVALNAGLPVGHRDLQLWSGTVPVFAKVVSGSVKAGIPLQHFEWTIDASDKRALALNAASGQYRTQWFTNGPLPGPPGLNCVVVYRWDGTRLYSIVSPVLHMGDLDVRPSSFSYGPPPKTYTGNGP
jgi:hypothetical protein